MPWNQPPIPDEPLTAAQIRFCDRYVEHGNATRAFREAGLTAKNPTAARRAASWLLARRSVRKLIDELQTRLLDAALRSHTEDLNRMFPR